MDGRKEGRMGMWRGKKREQEMRRKEKEKILQQSKLKIQKPRAIFYSNTFIRTLNLTMAPIRYQYHPFHAKTEAKELTRIWVMGDAPLSCECTSHP